MGKKSDHEQQRPWAFNLNTEPKILVAAPFGSLGQVTNEDQKAGPKLDKQNREIKTKKAWEIAKSPGKNIFMTGFMLWMIGSSINIFTMVFTFYALYNPLKAIFSTSKEFSRFSDLDGIWVCQIVYILLNGLSLGIGVYKCSSLGLLPTATSDWVTLFCDPRVGRVFEWWSWTSLIT
eukprot:TRINITY_DN2641_c0_g1_i1.p1 TRINITY_DN2641_c0_g1~~TRINITY_DN2641_c0_g1_i1.p1  ORF type:complete len:189 (+),score=44.60 TRINITY_DN2641_c0_g1_i1:38-568(+)